MEIVKNKILVVFEKEFPSKRITCKKFDTIVAHKMFKKNVESLGCNFVEIESFIEPGSIYEASAFLEKLSKLTFPDGTRVSKSFMYKGYELWWMHYNSLFHYFCLPYTRYKKLLKYLKDFNNISFYQPQYKNLFSCYLHVHKCKLDFFYKTRLRFQPVLPFGVLIQILITVLSLFILMIIKKPIAVFTGDKFEKTKDYDSKMQFIYEELRQKNLHFVEFVRSLESWKMILQHAFVRKRPVIYSEAILFTSRFFGFISFGHYRAKKKINRDILPLKTRGVDLDKKFKFVVTTQYLLNVNDDIWAIRIMKLILQMIGVKATIAIATSERNFSGVLGCKLNNIPTIGIMHGVASRDYNVCDFTPAFDGEKILSVDKYGLWSEWWKEYYLKNSKAYKPEQLFVSGPMRPLEKQIKSSNKSIDNKHEKIKVLLVSEIVAVPDEIIPYLEILNETEKFSVYIKFRAHKDSFEKWLKKNRPDILNNLGNRALKGNMQESIELCDVVVGSQSTGVIEATLQDKPFVLFKTKKWGDYFDMKSFDSEYNFFAENPEELVCYVKESNKIPNSILKNFREKFFGNPYKNGSKWVVEQIENILIKSNY